MAYEVKNYKDFLYSSHSVAFRSKEMLTNSKNTYKLVIYEL